MRFGAGQTSYLCHLLFGKLRFTYFSRAESSTEKAVIAFVLIGTGRSRGSKTEELIFKLDLLCVMPRVLWDLLNSQSKNELILKGKCVQKEIKRISTVLWNYNRFFKTQPIWASLLIKG